MSDEPSPNPWRETVRSIYDQLHFGSDNVFEATRNARRLARRLVTLIEGRHADYFCEAAPCESAADESTPRDGTTPTPPNPESEVMPDDGTA